MERRTTARIREQAEEAVSRFHSSECTPGLDRPLCNYHFFLFNMYLTTLESLTSMQIKQKKIYIYVYIKYILHVFSLGQIPRNIKSRLSRY